MAPKKKRASKHDRPLTPKRKKKTARGKYWTTRISALSDPRLPRRGTKFKREYNGRVITVHVGKWGLIWKRKEYGSLSALAKAVTGYATISGFAFFRQALEAAQKKT